MPSWDPSKCAMIPRRAGSFSTYTTRVGRTGSACQPGGSLAAMARNVDVPIALRWGDFDALGHVNNAIFLSYLEIARDRLMREALGDTYLDMVIVRVEIDFRAEIPLGVDEVRVSAEVAEIGTSSLRTRERIVMPDGTVAAESLSVGVVRDRSTRRSRPWSEAERAALGSG